MTRVIGVAMLIGLTLWCAYDPSVVTETIHALFCRCLGLDDERAQRDHERAMDALEKASRR